MALRFTHFLRQLADGSLEPAKALVNKTPTGTTEGHVLTAGSGGVATYQASVADPTGASAGHVFTADGADGASYSALPATTYGWNTHSTINTTSGTSATFSSIPSGVNEMKIIIRDVSSNASDTLRVRIGDSGGLESAGYSGASLHIENTTNQQSAVTTEFRIDSNGLASSGTRNGIANLTHIGSNTWVFSSKNIRSDAEYEVAEMQKTLSGELTQLSVYVNSSNFNGGSATLIYR